MSFDVAKNLTVDTKKCEMKGTFAPNNVVPQSFEKVTYRADEANFKDFEAYKTGLLSVRDIFKIDILSDLMGGMIQMNKSVSVKYRYALLQVQEQIVKQEGHDYIFSFKSDLVASRDNERMRESKLTDKEYVKEIRKLKGYTDYFYMFIDEAKNEYGNYIVQLPDGFYLVKDNKWTYNFGPEQFAKRYNNLWEAELANSKFGGKVINL